MNTLSSVQKIFLNFVFFIFLISAVYGHFPDPIEHIVHKEEYFSYSDEFTNFDYSGFKGDYVRVSTVIKYPLYKRLGLRIEIPYVVLNMQDKRTSGLGDILPSLIYELKHTEKICYSARVAFETPTGKVDTGIGSGHLDMISSFDTEYTLNEKAKFHAGIDLVTNISEHEEHEIPLLVHPHNAPEAGIHLGTNIQLYRFISFNGTLLSEYNFNEGRNYLSALGLLTFTITRKGKKIPVSVGSRIPFAGNNRFNWSIYFQVAH